MKKLNKTARTVRPEMDRKNAAEKVLTMTAYITAMMN